MPPQVAKLNNNFKLYSSYENFSTAGLSQLEWDITSESQRFIYVVWHGLWKAIHDHLHVCFKKSVISIQPFLGSGSQAGALMSF